MTEEYLTSKTNDRLQLFPIKHKDMWEQYKKHELSIWTVEEIDMTQDKKE